MRVRLDPSVLQTASASPHFGSFSLVYSGTSYPLSPFYAVTRSGRIRRLLVTDPLLASITVTPHLNGPIDPVINYLNGQELVVADDSLLFICDVAAELLLDEAIDILRPRLRSLVTRNEVLPLFLRAFQFGSDCSMYADYIAAEWLKMNLKLTSLPDDQIDVVLRSPYFTQRSDLIGDWIRGRVNVNEQPNNRLVKYLPPKDILAIPGLNINRLRSAILRCLPPE
jgi:hypothetical protein